MRLLRVLELALAMGVLTVLVVAGTWRPAGFRTVPTAGSPAADERPRGPVEVLAVAPAPSTRTLLDRAARQHGLPPHLVEALAYWESGWDQHRVSETGAVGLMQVQPEVAAELAPRLLGHGVDLRDPAQNADAGAAILRAYIDDQGGDVWKGLAAYYQGPQSLADDGPQPDTQDYADGILAIQQRLDQGLPPGG